MKRQLKKAAVLALSAAMGMGMSGPVKRRNRRHLRQRHLRQKKPKQRQQPGRQQLV